MPGFRSPLGFAQAREPELRALVAKPGGPTDEELDRFAESKGIASWSVELQFYGPEKTIAANWDYVQQRIGAAIPGARFEDGASYRFPLTAEQQAEVQRVHRLVDIGIPNMSIFAIAGGRTPQNPDSADGGQFYFAPMIPRTGEAILEANRVLGQAYRDAGLPYNQYFSAPACWHYRAFIMITSLPVSRSIPRSIAGRAPRSARSRKSRPSTAGASIGRRRSASISWPAPTRSTTTRCGGSARR